MKKILFPLLLLSLSFCQEKAAPPEPVLPVPDPRQIAWQELQFYGFVHFNMNTFSDREWGFGDEKPEQFNPTALDARQWARIAKEAGMKGLIITAKHHDGFVLWPSKYTEHSVKNSPWRDGKGDLIQEFVDACREYGLKVGIYYSPWDRNHPDYGKPEYITYMRNQLTELLTNYGEIYEVWFDGANGGDGYYGGVYLGACYTLAFINNDINKVVSEALKTIPANSQYYKCISDVIKWHKQYPNDWTKTWLEVQNKWANDIGCPDGVFAPFNIDATVNSAYVVIGLLYGNGDFGKTIEISTRCGQDADCNPSSAAGILGAMIGYDKIPTYWKLGLQEAEDIDFKYTSTSLNDVYEIGFKHALQNIKNNGGSVSENAVSIPYAAPKAVAFEQSFDHSFPTEKINIGKNLTDEYDFDFEGNGFVVRGETAKWASLDPGTFELEVFVDGKLFEKVKLPVAFTTRRHEITWKYKLATGKHRVKLKVLNKVAGYDCKLFDAIVYAEKPFLATNQQYFRLGN